MKYLLIFSLFLFFILNCSSNSEINIMVNENTEKIINSYSVYVAGKKYDQYGSYGLVKKYDEKGIEDIVSWNKALYNDLGSCEAKSIAIDNENNIYCIGHGNVNWAIKKFTSGGIEDTINWNKIESGGKWTANTIAVDKNNDVYVSGNHDDFLVIKKYNLNGIENANFQYFSTSEISSDKSKSIAFDDKNNLFIVCQEYFTPTVGSSSIQKLKIKRFSSSGVEDTTVWNKIIEPNDQYNYQEGTIVIDKNNNIFLTCLKLTTIWEGDWIIKKFNSEGIEDIENWNKTITTNAFIEFRTSLVIDSYNDIYAGGPRGKTPDDWLIKKYTNNGIEYYNWNITYGGLFIDILCMLNVDDDGNLYAIGTSRDYEGIFSWVIKKYDRFGIEDIYNWDKVIYVGNGYGLPNSIAICKNN